jgi:hypothetical protein
MSLAIPPITPAVAALAADLGVALQPGTVVTAQVLQLLDANLVRVAIAGLTLDVAVAKPLQPGQTLQLAVAQTSEGLSLTPVTSETTTALRGPAVQIADIPLAPRSTDQSDLAQPGLSPAEARAVVVATQTAVTKQSGLSPLFANLSAAVVSSDLPQPVLIAAAQLLGLRLPADKALSGGDLKAALKSSGLLMEASLAMPTPSPPPPDIKAALLMLRQTLSAWLGQAGEAEVALQSASVAQAKTGSPLQTAGPPAAQGQVNAPPPGTGRVAGAQAMVAVLQELGASPDVTEPVTGATNLLAVQVIASASRTAKPPDAQNLPASDVPPPVRGAAPSPQAVAAPSLVPDAEPASIARQLLANTEGALGRQTLLQAASLLDVGEVAASRTDPMQPRWNFEIPFITPQGTAMAQFEVARDGGGYETEAAERIWRARFSLDIEPAGPVHALITFSGDKTSVRMWAERPATAAQLRANASQLTQSFDGAELKAGDIVVSDGAPLRGRTTWAGHFLNRAT